MDQLYKRIATVPQVFDSAKAKQSLEDLSACVSADRNLGELRSLIDGNDKVGSLVSSIFGTSPFLTGLILRDPATLQNVLTSAPDLYLHALGETLDDALSEPSSQREVMAALRHYKTRAALCIALADIGGVWTIDEVTQALSDVADQSVASAVRHLLSEAARAGNLLPSDPEFPDKDSGYFVLGMGKLGAGELNFSSDIDLIVFFDAERAPLKAGLDPASFFVRLTRDLVRLLQDRTAEGYVWRTDLRLRPDPGATQLALSTDAGLTYYESFGQNWERAALIKARTVAGDLEAGQEFLAQLSPFIWRRYLDFAAVADIHAMKRRVHEFKGHAKIAVAGHDVKLGRGGIREIEFFTQTQQLIAGGRQGELRSPRTLETLQRLAGLGWIDTAAADSLSEAYRFLRFVEHRLQMIADEQTHKIPSGEEDIRRVACFCGFETSEAFSEALVSRFETVQSRYDDLFARLPDVEGKERQPIFRGDDDSPEGLAALTERGFGDPDAAARIIRAWEAGRYAATRSQRSREALGEMLPELLDALSATDDPGAALISFDRFLSELPAGIQLFSLLRSNTSLLRLIADILGTAPRLARVLSRRSQVLDAVLDPGFFGDVPTPETLQPLIEQGLIRSQDYQDYLDRARRIGQEQAFLIGVRVLSGTIGADQAGGAYACLAQLFIDALHHEVDREMVRQHGRIDGGQAVVVAMGKLGGREMTASSDLDLIIIYDFEDDAGMSDGARPLMGGQYYSRFTQRLISALSAQTAEGALYEVDMRLRPSGNSGPVATHFEGFLSYQQSEAWTWEHLALTRARVLSGPDALKHKVEAAIRDVLTMSRDRKKTVGDVHAMRARIDKEKGTDDIWDLKHVRGGLVDLEFIAQFLQIMTASENAEVLDQNTARSLEKLTAAGALSADDAQLLIPAAHLYHNLTQVLRLCLDRPFDEKTASSGLIGLLLRATEKPDFQNLRAHLRETVRMVRAAYERIVT
ncbi:MAG: bifunctional [glutamine synthetase] adenylyltransferase/[glutamine synthetase]-adenylyl-L-tyrosine phosphorylase [Hyphomicrobiaceae bacterium]|nr:bifunctional [glutamine synthetase] adenylyltransferase/[glutamine synthetase]-adenylyl-L-tyrosine phosphorylase [Hyphomicrobiaceae bacterium]